MAWIGGRGSPYRFCQCIRLVDWARLLIHIQYLSNPPVRRVSPLLATPMSPQPSHPVLQELHSLDRSLSKFHDQLSNILYGEEYMRCLANPQGNDLEWLVDYLDEVHHRVALPCSPIKPAQALDGLPPSSPAFRKCLRELRGICGTGAILPTSYTLSSRLNVNSDPFASGGYGDVYHGKVDGSRVCVKRVRMYTKEDPKKTTKVCYRRFCFPRPPSLTEPTGLLQGSRDVETLETSKHRTPTRYYSHTLPAHFELDAWRGPS